MTQTNTDYLLQIAPAVSDRTYGVPAANDSAGKFDDHLSQAATTSLNDSQTRAGLQRTEPARYDRGDQSSNTSAPKQDSDTSSRSQSSQPVQDEPSDAVSESTPPTKQSDCEEHENHESDDTTAAEAAAASQVASSNTKKTDTKTEPKTKQDTAATTKVTTVTKKAGMKAGDPKSTDQADGHADPEPSPDAARNADDSKRVAIDTLTEAGNPSDKVDESQATNSEAEPASAGKSESPAVKSNKVGSAPHNSAISEDSSVEGAAAEKKLRQVAQSSSGVEEASAKVGSAATTKSKSAADEKSDDDSKTDSHNDTSSGVRNDTSVQPTRVDAAQLAGGIPVTSDAGANTTAKAKDNDETAKPIAAKSEPAAVAFARMARGSVAASKDSASGTGDAPQVDPSRFIGRVAKAFQTAQDRGGTLQLRLSPPELGALRIELNVKDGVMSASLQAENATARRLLLDHLPALRDRLAEQNIRIDRFDVDVRDGSGGQTDTRGSQQQQFQNQPDQPAPRRAVQPQMRAEVAVPERIAALPHITDTGLNLII